MAGIFGAWVAAVTLAYLGEQLGERGSALIAVMAFFAVSGLVALIKLVERLTVSQLRASSPEAQDLFNLTMEPTPFMLLGACLVLAAFGPFVWAIRAFPPPADPERRAPEF